MALFCSLLPCKIPILCCKFQRNYAIQRRVTSRTPICKTYLCEITYYSVSAPIPNRYMNTFIQTAKCRSSLSSPSELDNGSDSNVIIFIKGLAQSTSEGVLKTTLSRYGEVSRVKIVRDKRSKQSLGFGYVWFVKEKHARAAVDEMNGEFLEGRFVHVSHAEPESCKTRPKHEPYKF